MHEIGPGSRVKIHFTLILEDGTQAFTTHGEGPLECVIGDGTLRPGMELALYGLRAGDSDEVTLTPEQGWGEHDPALVQLVPRARFPADLQPEPGQIIVFEGSDGEEIPGAVLALDDAQVEVDFNHPLAGHHVTFRVEVLAAEATEAES